MRALRPNWSVDSDTLRQGAGHLHVSHYWGALVTNRTSLTTTIGRLVTIDIEDCGERISVTDDQGEDVGSIELRCLGDERYYITWMYLDKQGARYLRQGIGEASLRFHKECFDSTLYAAEHDGTRKSDGSHLTGDAPGFIRRMRDKGLIAPESLHGEQEDDG